MIPTPFSQVLPAFVLAFAVGQAVAQDATVATAGLPLVPAKPTQLSAGQGRAPTIPVLEFSNTNVRSVYRLLAEYSGIDIVVDPDVNGTVNMIVTEKTWQEVVHIVARMLDLTVTNERSFLYVQTTESYNQKILARAQAQQSHDAVALLQRKILRINNARAADLSEAVTGLLSPRGKITVVERSNSLILLDGPDQIASIERLVEQLDKETDQVMIEAKLIQVESGNLQELGIDWSLTTGPGMGWGTAPGGALRGQLDGTLPRGGQIANNTPTQGSPAQTVAFGLLHGNLGVVISHLLSTQNAEVLATPQITTLDNTEATIFMGDQVPIMTRDPSGNTVTTFVNAGTELKVTPQITAPDRVMLNLSPRRNSYIFDPRAGIIIQKQEATTNVVVGDGETIVIGGLVSREEMESETGIPLLKDIPILGALFRYSRTEISKKDLVIFVTPHIVRTAMRHTAAVTAPRTVTLEDGRLTPTPALPSPATHAADATAGVHPQAHPTAPTSVPEPISPSEHTPAPIAPDPPAPAPRPEPVPAMAPAAPTLPPEDVPVPIPSPYPPPSPPPGSSFSGDDEEWDSP